ncbi:Acyltransferase ato1 [Fusarium oxysporum f. sp. albedinis]|nr:Acyltransferase ato1 [Fusarium oxysporum f. sp. albedinis]
MGFQAFCAKFEEAVQQFASGPQRRFAQQFTDSFLGIWKRELSCSGPAAPKPTYSSVAAATPPTDHERLTHLIAKGNTQRVCLPPLPEQPGTVEGAWLNSASYVLED